MSGLVSPGFVDRIVLVDYKSGRELLNERAIPHRTMPYMYYIGPFIPPSDNIFYVVARGKDENNFDFQRIALRSVKADKTGGPRFEFLVFTSNTIISLSRCRRFSDAWNIPDKKNVTFTVYSALWLIAVLQSVYGQPNNGTYLRVSESNVLSYV